MPYYAGATDSLGNFVSEIKWGNTALGTPSGPVTWSANYVTGLDHSSSFTDADFDAALVRAFDTWESVASIDFQQVPVGSGADFSIFSGSLPAGVAGQAGLSFGINTGLSQIFSGSITFASDLFWSPTGGPGSVDFEAVALHEIGHILGLGHVNDTTEIMNPIVFADSLGTGDIAGAQYLYGRDPGDAPAQTGEANVAPGGSGGGISDDSGGGGSGAGLLLGLLAALAGLLLGGGAAAGALLAAGRVSSDDESDAAEGSDSTTDGHAHNHAHCHDHGHVDLTFNAELGLYEYTHSVFVPDPSLPMVPFDDCASPCGHYGPCECALEDAAVDLMA